MQFPRSLNIVVTSANSSIGRRSIPRLCDAGHLVTALVREPIDLPATRIIPNWTTSDAAMEALQSADIIVHLSGVFVGSEWQEFEQGTVNTARRVADAAMKGQRVIYFSYVDADPRSHGWYQRSKGLAEEELQRSSAEVLIFRLPPIVYGRKMPGAFERRMLASSEGIVRVLGDGLKTFSPVFVDDVVEAILRSLESSLAGTFDLVGPESLTVIQIVQLLNGPSVVVQPVLVEPGLVPPGIPQTAIDLFTGQGRIPDRVTAWEKLGIKPTKLFELWR